MQQAFIKALSKPNIQQQSIQDPKKFVAWMCELTKYEALTNRQEALRQSEREIDTDVEICEISTVLPAAGATDARMMLEKPFVALDREDQALLHALYAEGKTISDLAKEQQVPWTTIKSRVDRAVRLLSKTLGALPALLVVLLPKKARALVVRLTQTTSRLTIATTKLSSVLTFAAVCGATLPASSSVPTLTTKNDGLAPYGASNTTPRQTTVLAPSFASEVELEEPKVLDAETNECSAQDMKFTHVPSILPKTLVSLALTATPALTQVACAGTEQQTLPVQQGDDEDTAYGDDVSYRTWCAARRRRGDTCPTKEEWIKGIRGN